MTRVHTVDGVVLDDTGNPCGLCVLQFVMPGVDIIEIGLMSLPDGTFSWPERLPPGELTITATPQSESGRSSGSIVIDLHQDVFVTIRVGTDLT